MDLNCVEEDDFVVLGKGPDDSLPESAAFEDEGVPDSDVCDETQGQTVNGNSPAPIAVAAVRNQLVVDKTELPGAKEEPCDSSCNGNTAQSAVPDVEKDHQQHAGTPEVTMDNQDENQVPVTTGSVADGAGSLDLVKGCSPESHGTTQDQGHDQRANDTVEGTTPQKTDALVNTVESNLGTNTTQVPGQEHGAQEQHSQGLIDDTSNAAVPEHGAQEQHSQGLMGDAGNKTGIEHETQEQHSQGLMGDAGNKTGTEHGTQEQLSQGLTGGAGNITGTEHGTQEQLSQGLMGGAGYKTGTEHGTQEQLSQGLTGGAGNATGTEHRTQEQHSQGLMGGAGNATGTEHRTQEQHSQGLMSGAGNATATEHGTQGVLNQEPLSDTGTVAGNDHGPPLTSATHTLQEKEEDTLHSCTVKLTPYHNRIMIKLQVPREHDTWRRRRSKPQSSQNNHEVAYRIPSQSRWKFVTLSCTPVGDAMVDLKGMIGDLFPGTKYEIFVKSVSSSGLVEAISLFRTTRYVGPPAQVTVNMAETEGMAVISWHSPLAVAPGVTLSGYSLQTVIVNPLQDDNGQSNEVMYPATTLAAKVPVDPTKSYLFQVRAHCKHDISDEKEVELYVLKHVILRQSAMSPTKGKPIFQIELRHNENLSSSRFPLLELGYPKSGVKMNEKVILVIGATGAGKTTLINGLINYVLGVEYSDPYRFKLVTEVIQEEAKSVTKIITTYTLHHQTGFNIPYTLTVIDTPGFGDTEGITRDKQIAGELFEFFKSDKGLLDRVNAVGFVASASSSRLTPTQQYIFDSILALFGKDIKENIYLLLTFADGKPPQILSAIRAANFPNNGYFKFNNSAIFDDIGTGHHDGTVAEPGAFDDDEEEEGFNKMFWDLGMRSFQKFLEKIEQIQPKSLKLTREVLEQRERIELYIEELHRQVKLGLQKQEQLIQERKLLRDHEALVNSAKGFTYQVMEAEVVMLPIKDAKSTTTCLECNYTCHPNCIFDKDEDKHKCSAMDPSSNPVRCKICINKCQWNVHKNTKYHYVTREVMKTKTSEDLKARYEYAVGQHVTATQLISDIMDEFDGIQGEIVYAIVEIRASLNKLQDIALKDNPLSTVGYIDTLILSEQNQAQPGWQARIEHLQQLRENAKAIHDIAKGEFDPFEDYRDRIEEARIAGVNFKDKKSWTQIMKRYKPQFEKKVKTKRAPCRIQ